MNFDSGQPDGARNKLLVKVLLGLVLCGLVFGAAIGFISTSALDALGLKEQPQAEQTTEREPVALNTLAPKDDETTSPSDEETPAEKPTTPKPKGSLNAAPSSVPPGGLVTLTGRLRSAAGQTLQVQRQEDGTWTDFPVTATVGSDGTFTTSIQSERVGEWKFRLKSTSTTAKTPVTIVTIG